MRLENDGACRLHWLLLVPLDSVNSAPGVRRFLLFLRLVVVIKIESVPTTTLLFDKQNEQRRCTQC
jgi:hypothetical protein